MLQVKFTGNQTGELMVSRLSRGEVKHSEREGEGERERERAQNQQVFFQTQQSPGAQPKESSSRHLFVALFWSSAWLWSTKQGLYWRSGSDRVQLIRFHASEIPVRMHHQRPPRSKLLQLNHTVKVETHWGNMWSCKETLNKFTVEPSKRQNKLEQLGYLSESVFHQRTEWKRGSRKKKGTTDATGVIHKWKWLIENNGWRRWLDEWLTD